MQSDPLLQQILECCYWIQFCRCTVYPGFSPIDAMVGELDWYCELYIVLGRSGLLHSIEPNAHQVGGDHYRKLSPEYQHWDMAADFGLNYFTSAATKYVARWRDKDGLRGLEKAVHYIDKLISLYRQRRGQYRWPRYQTQAIDNRLYDWCRAMKLSSQEIRIMELAITYRNEDDLLLLRSAVVELHAVASNPKLPQGHSLANP